MSDRGMRVLQAAQIAANQLNELIDRAPRGRLLNVAQMRDSVNGIPANIAEGLGRRRGADRNYKFEVACGEAKETVNRLKPNFETGRLRAPEYWPIHNLLETVIKMLEALISHG